MEALGGTKVTYPLWVCVCVRRRGLTNRRTISNKIEHVEIRSGNQVHRNCSYCTNMYVHCINNACVFGHKLCKWTLWSSWLQSCWTLPNWYRSPSSGAVGVKKWLTHWDNKKVTRELMVHTYKNNSPGNCSHSLQHTLQVHHVTPFNSLWEGYVHCNE